MLSTKARARVRVFERGREWVDHHSPCGRFRAIRGGSDDLDRPWSLELRDPRMPAGWRHLADLRSLDAARERAAHEVIAA